MTGRRVEVEIANAVTAMVAIQPHDSLLWSMGAQRLAFEWIRRTSPDHPNSLRQVRLSGPQRAIPKCSFTFATICGSVSLSVVSMPMLRSECALMRKTILQFELGFTGTEDEEFIGIRQLMNNFFVVAVKMLAVAFLVFFSPPPSCWPAHPGCAPTSHSTVLVATPTAEAHTMTAFLWSLKCPLCDS